MLLSTNKTIVGTSVNNAVGQGEQKVVQAQLATNLNNATLVSGNANTILDTVGTGNWKFYVAGNTSVASISSASASSEWSLSYPLSYVYVPPPPTDYSLYYTFDSSPVSGNTITDSVSNSVGTLTNGATISTSFNKYGTGSMDLTNQSGLGINSKYLKLPTITISQITGFSVSFWMYPSSTNGGVFFIFDFATASAESNNNMLFLVNNGSYNYYPNISTGGAIIVAISGTLLNDQWNHACITINSTNFTKIYINKTAIYSGTPAGNAFVAPTKTDSVIGSSYYAYPGLKGYIDDFKIYNRELTLSEVNALCTGPTPAKITDSATGATWMSASANVVDTTETSYTVKSTEIALTPGTNSTYAVWTAPKTTNIRLDVSFADYHTRSAGVGFQIFKINSDNTFGSVLFPRTVTSTALTDAAPTNYLSVPSKTISVTAGDKIYYRVDANGNTTSASSVLATNIYSDNNYIPPLSASNINETKLLQAQLATNLNNATLVSGNANTVLDTIGTGNWKFYVAGNTSVASITSASDSSEWTGGSLLSYIEDYYVLYYNFDTTLVSGNNVYNNATQVYDASLVNATIVTTSPSLSVFGSDRGYLVCSAANYLQINGTYLSGLTGTSIALWINVNGTGGDIFNSSDGAQSGIQLSISGGNSIALSITNNAGDGSFSATLYTNAAVNNGSWHHIALVMTPVSALSGSFTNSSGNSGIPGGVARWQLFFDGTSVYDITWPNGNLKYPDYIVRGTNKIGPITALIDDFRVYNIELTTSNIAVLYSRFSSWYKFNSATGNNTIDSINGNTAVLSGGASIQTATPSPIGGGYVSLSSALQQYITIPQFGVGSTSLGYSFFFKTELSSAHKILTSFSISQFNAYVTLGIVGNNVYLNMNLTNGLAYSAGGATFQNSFSTFSNLTSHTGGDIAVSVDDKIMVIHKGFNASVAQSILLSNFSGSTWGVPTIIGSMVKLWNLAITSDGKRIVATQKGGYVFVSTWNGTSFSAFVQTSDATSRTYTGLGMTADGSRIVCCTNESGPSGNVYMALWNESTGNYNAFTTIVTGISTSIGYDTMCISVDGFKIAYSSGTTGYWAIWNGIVYVQQTSFTCVTALNMKFTIDSNVLLMTTNSAVSAIYSVFFNGTTYASLTAYGGTSSLINKNLLGFHVGVSSYFYLSENGVTGGPYRNRVYWGTSYRTYRCNTITDNRWHNIYFNFYSPYFFEYWFDGNDLTNTDVLTNVDPNFGAFYSNKIITTNYIGLSLNSPLTFFDGSIDDLRFYNRRLSAAEMSFLMTGKMYVPQITSGASGPAWAPTSATAVDSSETSYTVKSTEVALKPGANSTFAVWTAPKTTNIRLDVSFADYHTRSAGVGFQIFKINSDNTFGSVLFPRTVTSTALTDAAPTNYLSVPSKTISVATGDKIYYRIDANGNTTAASSVLATNIYSDNNYIPPLSATNVNEQKVVQAQLATNLNNATLVSGNANTILDTVGTGNWKFYVAGNTSVASISSASSSAEWTGGSLLTYNPSTALVLTDYLYFFNFSTSKVSGTTVYDVVGNYTGTLSGLASVAVDGNSRVPGQGYLKLNLSNGSTYMTFPTFTTPANGFSFSMWFYSNNTPDWGRLFQFGTVNSDRILASIHTSQIRLYTDGAGVVDTSYIPTNYTWYHFVWTFASNGTWIVYINGTSIYNSVQIYPPQNSRASNYLGNSPNGEYLTGGIDNFRYYNYVLSPSNVTSIYNSGDNDVASPSTLKNDASSGVTWKLNYEFNSNTLSGNTIVDSVSGTFNATLMNGAKTSTTASQIKYGTGSLDLTGQSGSGSSCKHLILPTIYITNSGFTVSLWLYRTSLSNQYVFDFATAAGQNSNNMILHTNGSGLVLYTNITSLLSNFQSNGSVIKTNQWQHIVVTISATKLVSIYVDSVSVMTPTIFSGDIFTTGTKTSSVLGTTYYPNGGIDGYIDDFRTFNIALSASEITAIYNGGSGPIATLSNAISNTWVPISATPVDASETNYTVKSTEIALIPGTNSTYAVWTAPKSTNIRVDVSFADYHTQSAGVGFQIFKINSDNTFGSVIFPRTVTSTALTDAAPTNYLSVPSMNLSVATGDKIYYRIDANGNTTAASSVLATNIYSYSGKWS